MMRYISLLLLIVTLPTGVSFGQESLKPDSLLNWLKIIDLQDHKLISASDENGFFFAVKLDPDGDVLFANYEHSDGTRLEKNPRSFSLRIANENDEDLYDSDSDKRSPDSRQIEYSAEKRVGVVKESGSVTVAYSLGTIYPLNSRSEKRIKIQYKEKLDDDRTELLFEQWIEIPQPKNGK